MEDIDTDRLMRREVSPSEVETSGGDDENSDEEELVKVAFPSESPGENTLTLCSPINLGETFEREELQKLPQLQTRIMEMHFAKALGEQGFFQKCSSTTCAWLTTPLRKREISRETFRERLFYRQVA